MTKIKNLKTNVVKVKFLKGNEPFGREYTYYTDIDVLVGDRVILYARGRESEGVVTQINVDLKEMEPFKDVAKTITGKVPPPEKEKMEDVIDE